MRCSLVATVAALLLVPSLAHADRLVLNVPLIGQEQDSWCWAATTEMIVEYHGGEGDQCVYAEEAHGQTTCCAAGNTPACNQGYWVAWDPLAEWGDQGYASEEEGALSFVDLRAQIDQDLPVAFYWWWVNSPGGHAMVAIGYSNENGEYVVTNDPWPPGVGRGRIWMSHSFWTGSMVAANQYQPFTFGSAFTNAERVAYAVTDTGHWRLRVSVGPGNFATRAVNYNPAITDGDGIAAFRDRVFVSSGGQVWESRPGVSATVTPAGCVDPRGMDADNVEETLYLVCEGSDTLHALWMPDGQGATALYDLTLLVDAAGIDYVTDPRDVDVAPDGKRLAVVSDEFFAMKDGVTLVEVDGTGFGDAVKVPVRIDDIQWDDSCAEECALMYNPSDLASQMAYIGCLDLCPPANISVLDGLFFAANRGVAWAGGRVYASNFSDVECLTPSMQSCSLGLGHWVSVVDPSTDTLTGNPDVADRNTAVEAADDFALVGQRDGTMLIFYDGALLRTMALGGGGRPDSIAYAGDRTFVAYSDDTVCGMTVIDSSDIDPLNWTVEAALDTSLGCPRLVAAWP